jgi:hypothetical protein
VIDDAAVDLFGYSLVKTAVARFHVEDRHLAAFGRDHGEAAVCVAEREHGVEPMLGKNTIDFDDDLPDRFCGAVTCGAEKQIWRPNLEVPKEDIMSSTS